MKDDLYTEMTRGAEGADPGYASVFFTMEVGMILLSSSV